MIAFQVNSSEKAFLAQDRQVVDGNIFFIDTIRAINASTFAITDLWWVKCQLAARVKFKILTH